MQDTQVIGDRGFRSERRELARDVQELFARPHRSLHTATQWLGLPPHAEESIERFDSAQIPGFSQRSVERGDVTRGAQLEQRRAQQCCRRYTREICADTRQHQVERCRIRFGRQR